MSQLLGALNNKLLDLIRRGGASYASSMIPLTVSSIIPPKYNWIPGLTGSKKWKKAKKIAKKYYKKRKNSRRRRTRRRRRH